MVWDALKAVMRGRLISESTNAKKHEITYTKIYKNRIGKRLPESS